MQCYTALEINRICPASSSKISFSGRHIIDDWRYWARTIWNQSPGGLQWWSFCCCLLNQVALFRGRNPRKRARHSVKWHISHVHSQFHVRESRNVHFRNASPHRQNADPSADNTTKSQSVAHISQCHVLISHQGNIVYNIRDRFQTWHVLKNTLSMALVQCNVLWEMSRNTEKYQWQAKGWFDEEVWFSLMTAPEDSSEFTLSLGTRRVDQPSYLFGGWLILSRPIILVLM